MRRVPIFTLIYQQQQQHTHYKIMVSPICRYLSLPITARYIKAEYLKNCELGKMKVNFYFLYHYYM